MLFEGGYTQRFSPENGKAQFYTFAREIRHPTDRLKQTSAQAATRFLSDHRRFPPQSYEEESLVWRREDWRQPSPAERAQIHGLPSCILEHIRHDNEQQQTALRNSAVGNGFHIPSIMLALLVLLQPAPVSDTMSLFRALPDASEQAVRRRIHHTAFDPQVVCSFPGLLTAEQITTSMQIQLPSLHAADEAWTCTAM